MDVLIRTVQPRIQRLNSSLASESALTTVAEAWMTSLVGIRFGLGHHVPNTFVVGFSTVLSRVQRSSVSFQLSQHTPSTLSAVLALWRGGGDE